MKRFRFISLLALVAILFGCTSEPSSYDANDKQTTAEKTTVEQQSTADEDLQDAPEDFDFANNAVQYYVTDTTWENAEYVYTGDELSIIYEIATDPVSTEFALMVFIDGRLTPYHSSEDSVVSEMQVFKSERGVQKKEYTIYFAPLCGVKGEKYSLTVALIDNPNYMVADLSWPVLLPNHSMMEISKKTLVYDHETVKLDDVCTDYDVRELTDEVESRFDNFYAEGGNTLNQAPYKALLASSLDGASEAQTPDWLSLEKGQKLKLYIPFLGPDCEYRVSLYINYEAVDVFDGKLYLDVTVDRDKYTEKIIELDLGEYEGLSHIELMAVEKATGTVYKEGPKLFQIIE